MQRNAGSRLKVTALYMSNQSYTLENNTTHTLMMTTNAFSKERELTQEGVNHAVVRNNRACEIALCEFP
ncbi:hypothetical protein [Providencia stuartii]|uniref:hypothetical protein n=1 Tax=Providencia stuartii TaxID=588 RepID=UPI00254280A1|nr:MULTISPECIES: hypothetical protein [Providencia]MDN0012488.1 hypothetical protein [Providencia stuartii]MDN7223173.1 hypothetical protein [Providencia stuartii]